MNEGPTGDMDGVPWLVELAVKQQDSGPSNAEPVYDEAAQMTYVGAPRRMLAIESNASVGTKKADRETGEDQKGF